MLKIIFRAALTITLLIWVVYRVDFNHIGAIFSTAHIEWLLGGISIHLLGVGCAAWRWGTILKGMNAPQSFWNLLRLICIGNFFGMFLPTSMGSDVTKMVLLTSDVTKRDITISSVVMDRIIGLAVILATGLIAGLASSIVHTNPQIMFIILIAACMFNLGILILFSRSSIKALPYIIPYRIWNRLQNPINQIHTLLISLRQHPQVIFEATIASTCLQLASCISVYCAGLAFTIQTNILTYFALLPIGFVITSLPISINGLGVQDQTLFFLFSAVGIAEAQIFALSMYIHLLRNSIGLVGGILYTLSKRVQHQ